MSPLFCPVIGAVLISFSAVFVKFSAAGPAVTGFYRMLVGALILGLLCIAGPANPNNRFSLTKAAIFYSGLCGLFFAFDLALWHRSVSLLGPGMATMLNNVEVIFVILLGIPLLNDVVNIRQVLSLPLAFGGVYFLVQPSSRQAGDGMWPGMVFGVLSALSYAAFILALKQLRNSSTLRASEIMLLTSLCSLVPLVLLGLSDGESFAVSSWFSAGVLISYGITCHVLGWGLLAHSLGDIRASTAAIVLLLQPCLSYVWDIAFFDKTLGAVEACGAILLLAAVVAATKEVRQVQCGPGVHPESTRPSAAAPYCHCERSEAISSTK
jgi:drug/metabolite transporter (DMT)-like permease